MKKLFFILLALILLVCALDATLDFFYFAGPGKERLRCLLEDKLGTRVEIEKLRFHLFSGLTARQVVVYDLPDPKSGRPWLTVARLDLNPSYFGFLAKKIILKNVGIRNAQLNLIRGSDGKWNIPNIPPPTTKILVQRLQIKEGLIQFTDQAVGPVAVEQILSRFNLDAHFSLDRNIYAKLHCLLPQEEGSALSCTAKISLPSLDFEGKGELKNFQLHSLEPYVRHTLLDLKGLSGRVNGTFECSGNPKKEILLQTGFTSPIFNLGFTPVQVQGSVALHTACRFDPSDKKWSYRGELGLDKATLAASFLPDPLSGLHGKFLFENDFLTTNGFEGLIDGSSVRARGSLENFSQPRFHATLFTDLPPEKLRQIAALAYPGPAGSLQMGGKSFTQIDVASDAQTGKINWSGKLYLRDAAFTASQYSLLCQQLNGTVSFNQRQIDLDKITGKIFIGRENKLEANARLQLSVARPQEPGKKIAYTGTLSLTDGTARSSWLENPVTQIQSEIQFSPSEAQMRQLSGNYQNKPFTGNASLSAWDSPEPKIAFYLSSPEYSVLLDGLWQDQRLSIRKLNAYGFGSTCEVAGKVALTPQAVSDASFHTKIDTPTLQKAWPTLWKKSAWLRDWDPEGPFELTGTFQGAAARPKEWKIDTLVQGKQVSLKKIFFDDFEMKYRWGDQRMTFENIRGMIGEGSLSGKAAIDLARAPAHYSLEFKARGIDLKRLPQNKKAPIEGIFEGGISMDGISGKPDSTKGVAYVNVTDGQILDAPVLKPIWKVIRNLAPHWEKPRIESARGDFEIHNGYFVTDNLELEGPGVILSPKGKIGMDQTVDMKIKIKFFKPEGSNLESWAIEGLNVFGKLVEVEYTGTLSHPHVKQNWLSALDKIVSGE